MCSHSFVINTIWQLDDDFSWLPVDKAVNRRFTDLCVIRPFQLDHWSASFKVITRC